MRFTTYQKYKGRWLDALNLRKDVPLVVPDQRVAGAGQDN